MSNLTGLEGNWNEIKGKLKQKYATLTDNDVLKASRTSYWAGYRLNWAKPKKRSMPFSAICK